MAWAPVEWGYKAVVTSAKLAQMVENTLVHDHRSDGTRGAALVGAWITPAGVVTPAAGWSLTRYRHRTLVSDQVVLYDMAFTRTGAALTFNSVGNLDDVTVATGIPVRPTVRESYLDGNRPGHHRFTSVVKLDGSVQILDGVPNASIPTNGSIVIGGVAWLD